MQMSVLWTDNFQVFGILVEVDLIFIEWRNHKLDAKDIFLLSQVASPMLPNFEGEKLRSLYRNISIYFW